MNRHRICCTLALALLLTGCVTSFEPLVTDDNAIFDTNLVGTWVQAGGGSTWEFESENEAYRLVITGEEGKQGVFHGLLTELDGRRYLDLKPDPDAIDPSKFYKMHLLPMHSFMRLDLSDDEMQVSLMNIAWLQRHLEEHPDAIAVTEVDNRHILSAPTAELRDFVAAHAGDAEFFIDPVELERVE